MLKLFCNGVKQFGVLQSGYWKATRLAFAVSISNLNCKVEPLSCDEVIPRSELTGLQRVSSVRCKGEKIHVR